MNTLDQERLGLPSASEAYARRRCLGRQAFIEGLRVAAKLAPQEPSQEAHNGTLIHAVWAGATQELSSQQTETLEALQRLEALVLSNWSPAEPFELIGREIRLWLHRGITPIASGAFDVAYRTLDWSRLLILDAKTGFTPVQSAENNDQMRELAALAWYNYSKFYPNLSEITVAILQPNTEVRTSVAFFDKLEATLALRQLQYHLEDIRAPEHARTPGSYCRYCPALPQCPEALALSTTAHRVPTLPTLPLGKEGAGVLRTLLRAKPLLERYVALYKEEIASDPDCLPGFELRPPKAVRELCGSVQEIYSAAEDAGVTLQAFLSSVKCSVTALQHAYGIATGLKGRKLTESFNSHFASFIQTRQNTPELHEHP